MNTFKKLVLVDLDNMPGNKLGTIFSFNTPDTHFVFVGLKHPNKSKWEVIKAAFHLVKNKPLLVRIENVVPDATDMEMFFVVGKNIAEWKRAGMEQAIVFSGDNQVANIACLFHGMDTKTWIGVTIQTPLHTKIRYLNRNGHHLCRIMIK